MNAQSALNSRQKSSLTAHCLCPCSVWRSTWDISLTPPKWVLSPVPLPMARLPQLLTAPVVLLRRKLRIPSTPQLAATHKPIPVMVNTAAATNPELNVEVSVFGAVPDVCLRCCGSYAETSSVMHAQSDGARFQSGASRAVTVSLAQVGAQIV